MLSKRPSPVSRRELSIGVRVGAHRRKLGFSAQLLKSAFTRWQVVSKAKGVLKCACKVQKSNVETRGTSGQTPHPFADDTW